MISFLTYIRGSGWARLAPLPASDPSWAPSSSDCIDYPKKGPFDSNRLFVTSMRLLLFGNFVSSRGSILLGLSTCGSTRSCRASSFSWGSRALGNSCHFGPLGRHSGSYHLEWLLPVFRVLWFYWWVIWRYRRASCPGFLSQSSGSRWVWRNYEFFCWNHSKKKTWSSPIPSASTKPPQFVSAGPADISEHAVCTIAAILMSAC